MLFCLIHVLLLVVFAIFLYGVFKLSADHIPLSPPTRSLRSNGTHLFAPTTLLISLDGFRADFLARNLTPVLNGFIREGVSPKYMLPSFPSVTFPNHWTLVTGLYPEAHGVVGNSFWDPDLQKEFYYTDPARSMQPEWWTSTGAEPLWSTCEGQGIKTAVHMWPGSEAGVTPDATTVDKYNGDELLSKKVQRVLGFLDRPSTHDEPKIASQDARPEFVAMYVPNVDSDGHKYGPNSTETRTTIRSVDEMLGALFSGLKIRNLTDVVNVVVVSDHGMATTATERLVQLDHLLDPAVLAHTDGWPLYGLRPKVATHLPDLHERLQEHAAKPDAHFQVYLREYMPERYHFRHSARIAPLWIIPDTGWAIVPRSDFDVAKALRAHETYYPRGLHGYDHEHPLMRAIFVARGPAFPHPPGSRIKPFQNTEVYNIVCDSLGVQGRANNGTMRLPLRPVGVHGDEDDEDVKEEADPPDEPVEKKPGDGRPTPTHEDPHDDVKDVDEDEEEGEKGRFRKVWDYFVDKWNDTTDWLKSVFGGNAESEEDR